MSKIRLSGGNQATQFGHVVRLCPIFVLESVLFLLIKNKHRRFKVNHRTDAEIICFRGFSNKIFLNFQDFLTIWSDDMALAAKQENKYD